MILTVPGMAIACQTSVDTARAVSDAFRNFIELIQNLGRKIRKTG